MKKFTVCLLGFSLAVPYSYANDLYVAKNKLNADSITLFKDTLGYKIFNADKDGFCIVKDGKVLAFSHKGAIADNDIAKLFFPQSTNLLRSKSIYDKVDPLLNDIEFGQTGAFSNKLPVYVDGRTSVTGCVPVAVAQIMKYYNYPNATTADIPSYVTETVGYEMESIKKGTSIDWDNIVPCYESVTDAKKIDAVSDLFKYLCTSIKTDLRPDESSSFIENAGYAMINYFGYDKDLLDIVSRSHYLLPEFEEMIYNEIVQKRPVFLAGDASGTGHAFVCDGYDDGLFHVNWGWDGNNNGYYDMSLLAPDDAGMVGSSLSQDGYTYDCHAIIGIAPDNGKVDKHLISPNFYVGKFLEYSISPDLSSSGEISGSIKFTYFSSNFIGVPSEVALGYLDENGNVAGLVTTPLECAYDKYASGSTTLVYLDGTFKDNTTYRIVALERCDGKDWEPMENYRNQYMDIRISDGKVSASFPIQKTIEAKISFVKKDEDKFVKLSFINNMDEEYYDFVYVMLNDLDGYLVRPAITVPANSSITLLYNYSNYTSEANNTIRLLDSKLNFMVEAADDSFESSVANVSENTFSILSMYNGLLIIAGDDDVDIVVSNASGVLLNSVKVVANSTESICLQPGIYVVNGKKVLVK